MARPHGSKNKPKEDAPKLEETNTGRLFNGVARSMECVKLNGQPAFCIVTLEIKDNAVVSKKYSQPYFLFEAEGFLDIWNHWSNLNIQSHFRVGRAWGDWKKEDAE